MTMIVSHYNRLCRAAALLAITASIGSAAHAQFQYQAANNNGFVQLNAVNTAAGGALPVFDANGRMLQSGGFYPSLLNINTAVTNAVGNLQPGLNAQSGAVGNFGGGNATVFAQDGNGAVGIFSSAFSVTDNNNPANGIASVADFGGTADFVYNGVNNINFFGGSFGTVAINLAGKGVGSYGEFGIRGRIQVGAGVGANFVAANTIDSFISYGFGVGSNPYAAASTSVAGFNQVRAVVNAAGDQTIFTGYALAPIALAPGQTLRVSGALTIFGDPATVVVDTSNPTGAEVQANLPPTLAPEPASLALLAGGAAIGLGFIRRRRR